MEDIYKYGYGLLRLTPTELATLDLWEFLAMVEGALLWYDQEQKDRVTQSEYLLDWASWFTANLMVATGNYGKHPKVDKIKAGLFTSQAEREAEKRKDHKKKVASEQEALMARFNLAPDDLVQAEGKT